jgi:hypothetical protein
MNGYEQNYKLFILFISILISILLIIVCFKEYKKEVKQTDGFLDYQDVKTKTLNWCNKMQENGLLNTDQYNQCVSSFKDVSGGALKSGLDKSKLGMGIEYSLYNTRKKQLTPSVSNDNSNTILLTNFENQTMACRPNGSLYTVSKIDDPSINQKELYFTLEPINDTAYGILSPYGRFLVCDNNYNASFTGKSIGPLASWNLIRMNNTLNTNENVSNVMFESIQYPNFHLFYNSEAKILQIQNGNSDIMIWSLQTRSNNDNTDNTDTFKTTQFFVTKENILAHYKTNLISLISLQSSLETIKNFSEKTKNNLTDIREYVKNYLNNQKRLYNLSSIDYQTRISSISNNSMINMNTAQSLMNSIPKPIGLNLTSDIINQVITSIDNYRNTILQNINNNAIIPIQQQITQITNHDTSQYDYNSFISDLNDQIEDVNNQINQNKEIITRQKNEYETIYSDFTYQNNELNKLSKKDQVSNLNMNLLGNYQLQNKYLAYIYPIAILILFIGLLYLSLITYQKFVTNIWNKYQN